MAYREFLSTYREPDEIYEQQAVLQKREVKLHDAGVKPHHAHTYLGEGELGRFTRHNLRAQKHLPKDLQALVQRDIFE